MMIRNRITNYAVGNVTNVCEGLKAGIIGFLFILLESKILI